MSCERVRRWVAKFGRYYTKELRRREARAGRTWHLDQLATRIGGRVRRRWRALGEYGQALDVLLQALRDTAASERFFRRVLAAIGTTMPAQITTHKFGSYAAALARQPALADAEHVQARAAMRCNNPMEQARQATCVRERVVRRFKSEAWAPRVLEACSRAGILFRQRRRVVRAAAYRAVMRERAATWRHIARLQPA